MSNDKNQIFLLNPDQLRPHEQINIFRALYILMKIILSNNFTTPLFIDSKTKTILDGHHRRWVAQKLKFKTIPCYCVDYLVDQNIEVQSRRPNIFIDKQEVINMALANKVFPHKTTKHKYNIPNFTPLALNKLK